MIGPLLVEVIGQVGKAYSPPTEELELRPKIRGDHFDFRTPSL
jgi:hypothetical protein